MVTDQDETREATGADGFSLAMMFHPSHRVPDLAAAEQWYERVLGTPSARLDSFGDGAPQDPDNRTDYSTFTVIRDVVFDTIDPQRYVKAGVQQYPTVDEPHLNGFGWYVDGIAAAYTAIRAAGFQVVNQLDEVVETEGPPTVVGAPLPMFWTSPTSAGLRYQFLPRIPFPGDPRIEPGWTLPAVDESDLLGLDRCAQHIVLTGNPERALGLFVGVLGGRLVHEGRDEVLGAASSYVALADGVYEFAVPDAGTSAYDELASRGPHDVYHSLAFTVRDLDRAEAHLRSQGVGIQFRSDDALVTDPRTSVGIPWRFTRSRVPGDPRD